MEIRQYNTFKFFRRYFNLPPRISLQWCIVRESTRQGTEFRLGVALKGTELYIDVAMRRFFSRIDCPAIQRIYSPAERIDKKDRYEYRSSDGWMISKPKRYIWDIYTSSWYDEDTLDRTFL